MRKRCSFLGILRFATKQLQTLINGYVMRFIRVATAGCAKSYKYQAQTIEDDTEVSSTGRTAPTVEARVKRETNEGENRSRS